MRMWNLPEHNTTLRISLTYVQGGKTGQTCEGTWNSPCEMIVTHAKTVQINQHAQIRRYRSTQEVGA